MLDSGFSLSQIHPGQNLTSFNSPSNLFAPPPPAIALSSQFSYVRAEIQNSLQHGWSDSLPATAPECEKQSAQEDQWRLVHNDRSTRPENQLSVHQAGGCMTTLCTSSSFMQEATPGIFWSSGGAQFPCGSQIPAQNLMPRAPGGPLLNMDVGYNAYSDQVAGLTGGMVG
ncbi:hypothetical protein KI387_018347, partial [Taxus chinensis]